MRPHIIDRPKSPSSARLSAFLHLKRQAARSPSDAPVFRKAGQTIRSVRLRQFLRIERSGLV